MRQTTTIRGKIEEEKKQRGLDSTSRSMISDIKRSHSRPITPTKSHSKIPFIDESYSKSPMRTRNKIARTPLNPDKSEAGNDFQNDDTSQFDRSIISNVNQGDLPEFGVQKTKPEEVKKPQEEAKNPVIPPDAFYSRDLIPRTPPQANPKKHDRPPPEEKKAKAKSERESKDKPKAIPKKPKK